MLKPIDVEIRDSHGRPLVTLTLQVGYVDKGPREGWWASWGAKWASVSGVEEGAPYAFAMAHEADAILAGRWHP